LIVRLEIFEVNSHWQISRAKVAMEIVGAIADNARYDLRAAVPLSFLLYPEAFVVP
jgi:hypothetical protein